MRPIFDSRPIGCVDSLAAALGMSAVVLKGFAHSVPAHYTHFTIQKANGNDRHLVAPDHALKLIQKRINRAIFDRVKYPPYLFGGVRGRDYVMNAQAHSHAQVLLALDIEDFYGNITAKRVAEIFKYFFKFPDSVCALLTELTTLNGSVPQGACTSSHIANLIFHDVEHRLEDEFRVKHLVYTRLLDDICVSSRQPLSKKTLSHIVEKVSSLVRSRGLNIKEEKTRISSKSNPETLMNVTGLWLNRRRPRANRSERLAIRSEIHRCMQNFQFSRTAPEYHQEHNSVSGRVSKLTYLGHAEAPIFREKLRSTLPHFSAAEVAKTVQLVDVLSRTSLADRSKYAYVERYFQAMHRIGVVARNNRGLSRKLRQKLEGCRPAKSREEILYGA